MSLKFILIVLSVTAVLMLVCVVLLIRIVSRQKKNYDTLLASYNDLEELNSHLRAQRHDQLNHLQVVYGMCELGEYGEIENYLKPIYSDLKKTGKALKTSKPAINALIMAKQQTAEQQGIDFYVEVKSSLDGLKIKDWELCKILSNLIDNSITALTEKSGEKSLRIDINENPDSYILEVSNNGPEIPKEVLSQLFVPGFSTKKESGHGMGLAIVKKTVTDAGGDIKVSTDANETVFTVHIAK